MGLWLTINLEQYENLKADAGEAGIRVYLLLNFIYSHIIAYIQSANVDNR